MVARRKKLRLEGSSSCSIDPTSASRLCYRPLTPISLASTGTSCLHTLAKSWPLIGNISATGSMASTSTWSHSSARKTKGPGNLGFLPDLLDTYRAVRVLAEQNQMTVNADIPNKFLKGDLSQRQALLSSLPRLTLMLYELSSRGDGESTAAQADKLRQASEKFLNMAYQGLNGTQLARMSIGMRTPD